MTEQEAKILCTMTNVLADNLKTIRLNMEGKGVSPADASKTVAVILEIENKMRRLGCNYNNPLSIE